MKLRTFTLIKHTDGPYKGKYSWILSRGKAADHTVFQVTDNLGLEVAITCIPSIYEMSMQAVKCESYFRGNLEDCGRQLDIDAGRQELRLFPELTGNDEIDEILGDDAQDLYHQARCLLEDLGEIPGKPKN